MAATASTMRLSLGAEAPHFCLPDPSGRLHSLADFEAAPALLVVFMCNHCPYVQHVAPVLARLGSEFQQRGVAVVGINSNDFQSYPDDAPQKMAEEIDRRGYTFPYLVDEKQDVAKAYQAACTPDFYVFDKDRKLAYRGQMDASRPGNAVPVTGRDLQDAVEAVLAGRPAAKDQRPSIGCNIKWKPGGAPDYFG